MGHKFSHISEKKMEEIHEQTGIRRPDLKQLHKEFKKQHPKGTLKQKEFIEAFQTSMPNGDVSKFAERVFNSFDHNGDGKLDFTEYVIGMSITQKHNIKGKLRWVFGIYDVNKDGSISRDEMLEIIKTVYLIIGADNTENHDVTPEQRVDQIFNSLDDDTNGIIGVDEFIEGVKSDPSIAKLFAN